MKRNCRGESLLKRHKYAVILFFLIACVFAVSYTVFAQEAQTKPAKVEQGVLRAPDWQFLSAKPLTLDGDWQVVWGELLEPSEFDMGYKGEYFAAPGRWNGVNKPGIDGSFGVATFRAMLELPAYNRELSMHMISPNSAWRVYVDGVFVGGNGVVADNKADFRPHYVSRIFPATDRKSTIVLQVANFDHAYGGPGHSITIWDAVILRQNLDFMSLYYVLVLGILLAIGLIHLIFYLADRKHREQGPVHLWFSLLCFILVVRISGIIPFTHIYFPEAPYWSDLNLTYLSLFAAPAVYLLFFKAAFPAHFPKLITQILIGFSLFMTVFVLVTPANMFTHLRDFAIYFNVFVIIYTLIFTALALGDKQAGAGAIMVSNFLFLLTAINDAVIYTDNSNGFDLTPFGILVLGLGYSYALLLRLQDTFQDARGTATALAKLNLDLEKQVRDRTRAFKSAAAKAQNNAQERARFIAAASHDLRQPLHALALLNAVLRRKKPKADIAELVEKQTESIENLSTLLQDTLDTARAETGGKTPNAICLNIADLMGKITSDFEIKAQNRGIELSFDAPDGWLVTDRAMLQRILANLVDNALKAARSSVQLSAHNEDNVWVFNVKDDGAGIAREDIGRIFAPYVSLDEAEPDAMGGYGLGLYVVNEFTRLLGGDIKITETSKDGTIFTLRLANMKGNAQALRGATTQDGLQLPKPGTKVLAIDDEIEILDAMQALLATWQCPVRTALSVTDAKAHIKSGFYPDILLVDYHLAGTTGLAVISALRAFAGRDIPAIIITGATEPQILEAVGQAGFDMLAKPVKPELLGAALSAL